MKNSNNSQQKKTVQKDKKLVLTVRVSRDKIIEKLRKEVDRMLNCTIGKNKYKGIFSSFSNSLNFSF